MALQANLVRTSNFKQQVALNELYIKVVSAYCTKQEIHAAVTAFEKPNGAALFTEDYVCSIDLDGPNPIKQAYEYLKTLPEFSDAVDC